MTKRNSSILTSVKEFLGAGEAYEAFDSQLITLINSEISTLAELGVGDEEEPFEIVDKNAVWGDLIDDGTLLGLVPEYVSIRVKLIFDPPQSTYAGESLKAKASELEFRILRRVHALDAR